MRAVCGRSSRCGANVSTPATRRWAGRSASPRRRCVLAAFGEQLRSGEIIITGSVVPPLTIEPGEDAIAFEVDPVASVAVRFFGEFKT